MKLLASVENSVSLSLVREFLVTERVVPFWVIELWS